jgi:hypothetical protein
MAWYLADSMGIDKNTWWAVVSGAVGGIAIGLITEYYTGGKPVRTIAKSGETGPATVMITGLAGWHAVSRSTHLILSRYYLCVDSPRWSVWRGYCRCGYAGNSRNHYGD